MTQPTDLLTPTEAAAILHVSPATLAIWRCRRRYDLNYTKIGSKVLYKRSDVDAFIAARNVTVPAAKGRKR